MQNGTVEIFQPQIEAWDDDAIEARAAVQVQPGGREKVYGVALGLGGTVTGEHGIGVEKIDFMEKMFSRDDLEAMQAVRRAFRPDQRCNPHKIFPGSKRCMDFAPKKQAAV